jgi:uroporphyrinogen-III synthase
LAEPLVLVTRPEPGAAETAARVEARGLRAVLAPALVLSPLPHAALPPAQALLLPSRAAARALAADGDDDREQRPDGGAAARVAGPRLRQARIGATTRVVAVGEATAAAAREAGFERVEWAEGDAVSLAAHCQARLRPADGPLLLAAGRGYSAELAAALRGAGFSVIRRVVYAAAEAQALPAEAAAALRAGAVSHALFFSPRSARCSVGLLQSGGLGAAARGIVAIAISPRVAAALLPLSWREVLVASRPHQDPMLELLPTP